MGDSGSDGDDRQRLELRFDEAMLEIYDRAKKEIKYNASYFHRMLLEHGGLVTARRFLHDPDATAGFTRLWEKGRLDLSVEAYVLRSEFRPLFTEEELAAARRRLNEFGYTVRE
jgi:hypothetical protein